MDRRRTLMFPTTLGCCFAGLIVALFGYATASAAGTVHASAKVTRVTVTMTDAKFTFSASKVPVGTVVFMVVNRGKFSHNLKIAGKSTAAVAPGKSALLSVAFRRAGTYPYTSTIHAAAGMKGKLSVGASPIVFPSPTPSPAPAPASSSTPTPVGGATECASPVNTTVAVTEFDYGYTLSPKGSIPCGKVTFTQTNTGGVVHNFDIQTVPGGMGDILPPRGTTTFTVTLGPGKYTYVCDVEGHDVLGMIGTLTVTG